ncbi:MAG: GntR family transcriptional regulator [Actinobacteria bacterium]|nr:GntR family transcriptional regulator [Actinomycetota bacterium]
MSSPPTERPTPGAEATTPAVTPGASLDAMLRPVRSGNAFEEAIARILQAIKLGAVTTGERLPPERTLAKRLGISRVTLREALRALTDAGLVESRRGRSGGTFITYRPEEQQPPAAPELDGQLHDLDDTLILRAVLEPGAAATAAAYPLDDAARAYLTERLEEVAATSARQSHRLADARLHLAIAELTGSVSLIAAIADAQMKLAEFLEAIPILPPNIERSHVHHAAVVQAILAGRPDDARQQMSEHVDGTAALLRGFLG